MPAPRLLFDAHGELVAFATLAVLQFGAMRVLMHRFADGTPDGLERLLHCLPSVAHGHGCATVGGYVPTLPWLLEIFERSPVFKRATATEQFEFVWKNAAFADR